MNENLIFLFLVLKTIKKTELFYLSNMKVFRIVFVMICQRNTLHFSLFLVLTALNCFFSAPLLLVLFLYFFQM